MVAVFWGFTLYGSEIIRFASPVIVVAGLILGMWSRRYSPLSSTSKTGEKHSGKGHKREPSEVQSHHKTLDEIVDTLQELTARCNILLAPFLTMTDFLSTQTTPTAATTRPALTTLFIRVLLVTPFWIILNLPPLYILTPRRVILAFGTIALTWHSKPARVSRVILWRSVFMRKAAAFVTGLDFDTSPNSKAKLDRPGIGARSKSQGDLASEVANKKQPDSSGVRFTFILYENQRRWIGLGWTTSLFAYERGPWTDEHLNPAPAKDEFELPDVEGGLSKWRWIDSDWRIEHGESKSHKRVASESKSGSTAKDKAEDGGGWIFYDNRWEDGSREDGWGKYTRRRKWFRDAELVEATSAEKGIPKKGSAQLSVDTEQDKVKKAKEYAKGLADSQATIPADTVSSPQSISATDRKSDDASSLSKSPATKKGGGWFSRRDRSDSKSSSGKNTGHVSMRSDRSRDGPEDDVVDKWRDPPGHRTFSVQEDVAMSLG
jgi:hypothetical protein